MASSQKKESSFAGFIDGYKAKNIESIGSRLNIHIEEMSKFSQFLSEEIRDKNLLEVEELLKGGIKQLKWDDDFLSKLISFGERLETLLSLYKGKILEKGGPNVKDYLDKLVYHFLKSAKQSQDRTLLSMAVKIGEMP
jgi:hypothetical protein